MKNEIIFAATSFVLAVEQQFNTTFAITCPVKRERSPLYPILKKSFYR
jgi:hypothetical protein